MSKPILWIVIPCYNEAAAIADVIEGFAASLPDAEIHVFDNNSTDDTSGIARAHGATVHFVTPRGKGNVVRRMFADVDADVYVMVDGDATYQADIASELVDRLIDGFPPDIREILHKIRAVIREGGLPFDVRLGSEGKADGEGGDRDGRG